MFWAEYGPCYRCLYPEPPPPGMVPSCAEGGVLGVLCASIGSIQVNEAIKLITGIGEPLVGPADGLRRAGDELPHVRVRKDPECAVCGKNPTVTELIDYEAFCGAVSEEAQQAAAGSTITATELKDMLDSDDDIFLVDVREPNEYEIVSIPGATLIPKDEFLRGEALEQLPQDRRIVLHCKSGARVGRGAGRGEERRVLGRGARGRRRAGLGQPGRPVAAHVLSPGRPDQAVAFLLWRRSRDLQEPRSPRRQPIADAAAGASASR